MTPESCQNLDALIGALGRTGQRLAALQSCEGAAGNLSIFFRPDDSVAERFPITQEIILPLPAPALAGGACLVTGSGQRLRDIAEDAAGVMAVIVIGADGKTGRLHTAQPCRFRRVTSEFNSHLAVHQDRIARSGGEHHAVAHVQPRHLTFLSHIPAYQEFAFLNRQLLRWQPEMILQFPRGIGILPFLPPASQALMQASAAALSERPLVVWSKHGVLARSDDSIEQAADLIEYTETAAQYEYMNILAGSPAGGLTVEEMHLICKMYSVQPEILAEIHSGSEKVSG
ncbi:MAG: rhamnulose-1-phosphate aldolase [Anaerolineae bacterium]|nr:rhamnulose-1-phosphate aldolase [Anaerolineae bacterium]